MEHMYGPSEMLRFFFTPEDTTAPQTGIVGPGIAGTIKVLFHVGLAMGITVVLSVLK